ncbi:hypothetical protein Mapa_001608 [Marchantia paleacea]|nr:hypothetical protein Mapa_001608 [Marchantia paleacea]
MVPPPALASTIKTRSRSHSRALPLLSSPLFSSRPLHTFSSLPSHSSSLSPSRSPPRPLLMFAFSCLCLALVSLAGRGRASERARAGRKEETLSSWGAYQINRRVGLTSFHCACPHSTLNRSVTFSYQRRPEAKEGRKTVKPRMLGTDGRTDGQTVLNCPRHPTTLADPRSLLHASARPASAMLASFRSLAVCFIHVG